jgi:hypothetical protein
MKMPELQNLIGQTILALVPSIHGTDLQKLKLHGVENGGLWIESQELTNVFLSRVGAQTAPKTMVFFLPYHQISFVLGSLDVPSLSEKAYGVK